MKKICSSHFLLMSLMITSACNKNEKPIDEKTIDIYQYGEISMLLKKATKEEIDRMMTMPACLRISQ